jgi:uncharacterized protein involved in response to NO
LSGLRVDVRSPWRAAARSWSGPAILSHGFRPFFLSAGIWALIAIALWFLAFGGAIEVPTAFSIVDWGTVKLAGVQAGC